MEAAESLRLLLTLWPKNPSASASFTRQIYAYCTKVKTLPVINYV
jgi:hypothetical protein